MNSNTELLNSLSTLGTNLLQDVRDVRSGKLEIAKANSIADLSGKAIKSITSVVLTTQQQKIQHDKLIMRANELKFKRDELALKREIFEGPKK